MNKETATAASPGAAMVETDAANFQAVIRSAASAASPKTNQGNQDPGERPEAVVRQPSRRPGATMGFGSLDLVFGGAARTADLITA